MLGAGLWPFVQLAVVEIVMVAVLQAWITAGKSQMPRKQRSWVSQGMLALENPLA